MTNTATLEKPLSPLAIQLNEALKAQDPASPLNRQTICDRCPGAAQAIFTYERGDIYLCGHHMRANLATVLDGPVTSYWIEPSELGHIRGVGVPEQDFTRAGDGLTDA
ncbi:hypothetical protein [Arthrobacter sp. A2-55]|uniref:DUF7455 domain-containing protein n=1 Tax=Arthrobacter sp. A2-55 TaxID=2897337 RepID=UPI0021CD204D|nr:hypothetical protein [Arthrobacter sp. A2-55]MCU6479020.1 hypothetical protein [Arthrobacter sp. A2-55]